MSYVTREDLDAFRTEVRALVGDISREAVDAKFAEA